MGEAFAGGVGDGAVIFPAPIIAATGHPGIKGDGVITHNFTIAATAYHSISADGVITIDNIGLIE